MLGSRRFLSKRHGATHRRSPQLAAPSSYPICGASCSWSQSASITGPGPRVPSLSTPGTKPAVGFHRVAEGVYKRAPQQGPGQASLLARERWSFLWQTCCKSGTKREVQVHLWNIWDNPSPSLDYCHSTTVGDLAEKDTHYKGWLGGALTSSFMIIPVLCEELCHENMPQGERWRPLGWIDCWAIHS